MSDRWFFVLFFLLIVALAVGFGLLDTYVISPHLRRHVDRALGPEISHVHTHAADCACPRKERAS